MQQKSRMNKDLGKPECLLTRPLWVSTKKSNYKQFSYNELLRDYYPGTSEIYNILFLPGKYLVKEHFKYNPKYVGNRKIGTRIIEQYMLPKDIMQDYLQ